MANPSGRFGPIRHAARASALFATVRSAATRLGRASSRRPGQNCDADAAAMVRTGFDPITGLNLGSSRRPVAAPGVWPTAGACAAPVTPGRVACGPRGAFRGASGSRTRRAPGGSNAHRNHLATGARQKQPGDRSKNHHHAPPSRPARGAFDPGASGPGAVPGSGSDPRSRSPAQVYATPSHRAKTAFGGPGRRCKADLTRPMGMIPHTPVATGRPTEVVGTGHV
jgi:hypothetical protein